MKPRRTRKAAAAAEPQSVADFLAEFTPSEREEVARLAYSYWEQRGHQHGSHEEDWYRAEEEVRRRRAVSRQRPSRRTVSPLRPLDEEVLDLEFLRRLEHMEIPEVSLEEVRRRLVKIPGSLTADFAAERGER